DQQPHGDDVRQHYSRPRSIIWSTSSLRISVTAAVTSTPTATLSTGTVPPDSSDPVVPSGSTLSIAATPKTRPAIATSMYAAAPTASVTSTSDTGRTRCTAATCPAA